MSKNNKVYTRPVVNAMTTVIDEYSQLPIPKAEGPTYIITHQSHPTLRAVTITYKGDIEQWIKDNPQLYITHITKL
jgi:hypothetical protein